MSLYNFLFGINENADILLGVIGGLSMSDFGRFRDIYLNPEGTIITVLTRLGGGNREPYIDTINKIKENDNYIKDYDDDFDSTYAYFEFKVPEKYLNMCKSIAPKEKRPGVKELFDNEIKEMDVPGTPAYERAEKIAKQYASIFGDQNDDSQK